MNRPWLSEDPGIVLASRVRLARNIDGLPFRGALPPGAARDFCERVRSVLGPLGYATIASEASPDAAECSDSLLVPADLAGSSSPWMALGRGSSGVLALHDDHLRAWAIRPGSDFAGALHDLVEVESDIELLGPFSRDPDWGWRTASPEDVGTGMRASALLHVPALWLSRRLSSLSDGLDVLGGRLRSAWHDDPPGALVVVSNRCTLGRSELDLLHDLEQWVRRIAEEEERAMRDLVEHWGGELRDAVERSDAVLGAARLMSNSELQQRMALLALGVRLGWLPGRNGGDVMRLRFGTRQGTLRVRRADEIPEGHANLDDLRAAEARSLWNRTAA